MFCQKCGKEIIGSKKFCSGCGTSNLNNKNLDNKRKKNKLIAGVCIITLLCVTIPLLVIIVNRNKNMSTSTVEKNLLEEGKKANAILPANETVYTARQMEIGKYFKFGMYNSKPILWKVSNKDNGVILISETIICRKAFDAPEGGYFNKPDYSSIEAKIRSFGDNEWSNSNIREWLNSSDKHVNYTTQAPTNETLEGKGYENEPGFLSSFSQNEINCIDNVNHNGISDKIWLLSLEELSWLGKEYKRTLENGESSNYSLRGMINRPKSERIIFINDNGNVGNGASNSNRGVLPAFNLKQEVQITGLGSKDEPFSIK